MDEPQKLVYIAGPYRADTVNGQLKHVRVAEQYALKYWRMGYAVICPHKNTEHFGGLIEDAHFLAAGKEMLSRCDAVFTTTGWRSSEGAKDEVAYAETLSIPVFHDLLHFRAWLREEESNEDERRDDTEEEENGNGNSD